MYPFERMTSRVIEETSPSSDRCQPDHERAMIKDEQSNKSGSRKHNVKAALARPPSKRQTRQRTVPSHAPEPDPTPPNTQMCSFRLCEYEKVESYLRDRLLLMQQQALKRIAKAWIKGICPKKQAKFPYQNKRLEKKSLPEVPAWWPIDQCQYVEPDHIEKKGEQSKSERNAGANQ